MHTVLLPADVPPQTLPARPMTAFTLASHIVLVPLGVALPLITLVMHGYGLRRGDAIALLLARRWSAVMAVQFAIGVVTGTVLSFEFGLLWPGMMGRWGDVSGIGFGVEAWAFFLEAVLIAVYLYGWRRLPARTHFLLGLPLPLVALLGASGILAANSWMNTSRGFTLDAAGDPVDVKIRQAVFTPMFGPQYWHFVVAMFVTAGYVAAGVYAVGWLRGRRDRYHRLGFTIPFTLAAVCTPAQFVLGDSIARQVFHKQPVKFAAMEIVWKTDTHQPSSSWSRRWPRSPPQGC
ncbi:cytochrome ubiquinol oxidase subunit I [Streptomyces puniciscabiei]|uniref:cytochrome ubiquinol oxidase subunit I n=1 Tax=Streptomyces puniciscabiei TaxID=164348 RepID=UPI00378A446C